MSDLELLNKSFTNICKGPVVGREGVTHLKGSDSTEPTHLVTMFWCVGQSTARALQEQKCSTVREMQHSQLYKPRRQIARELGCFCQTPTAQAHIV